MKFAYLIEPPFNFLTQDGHVAGHDIDVARYIFNELNIEQFELIETEFCELLPGLAASRWNMTTGLFSTAERCKQALFSRAIWALPDGLLIRAKNPKSLTGYLSVAAHSKATLAVIRDQYQHRSAIALGVPESRLRIFDTYLQAAQAVRDGTADAYASVGRAHHGFIAQNADWEVDCLDVPAHEKPPAFGSFSFSLEDKTLKDKVDNILCTYLGSDDHSQCAKKYGFTDSEIALVTVK